MLAPALLLLISATANRSSAGALGDVSKGSALYRGCSAEVRLMDLPSLSKATQSDLLNGSFCVGYLNGFVANLHRENAICTAGTAVGSLVRVYVTYMARNPKLMEQDREVGLSRALRDAYPCPTDVRPGGDTPGSRATL